jgi:hypothetical protein
MKPSTFLVAAALFSGALISLPVLAQGSAPAAPAATAVPAAPAAAPAPAAPATEAAPAAPAAPAKAKKVKASGRGKAYYDACLKQNLADAEYFCSKNQSGCEAEKKGAAAQCRSEERGERQKE